MKSSLVLLTVAATAYASIVDTVWRRQSNWTVGQTVQTGSGAVTGHAAKNNSEVSEYLGIPYGQAPIGDLRFAAPVKFTGNSSLNGTSFVILPLCLSIEDHSNIYRAIHVLSDKVVRVMSPLQE